MLNFDHLFISGYPQGRTEPMGIRAVPCGRLFRVPPSHYSKVWKRPKLLGKLLLPGAQGGLSPPLCVLSHGGVARNGLLRGMWTGKRCEYSLARHYNRILVRITKKFIWASRGFWPPYSLPPLALPLLIHDYWCHDMILPIVTLCCWCHGWTSWVYCALVFTNDDNQSYEHDLLIGWLCKLHHCCCPTIMW